MTLIHPVWIEEDREMDTAQLLDLLADCPVIAAVKDDAGLDAALNSDVAVIFLLYGDILTVERVVDRVHDAGKRAFVHLDLIDGLSAREVAADFIARHTDADGPRPSYDRMVCIDRMRIDRDGKLRIDGPTVTPQPMPR